MDLRQRFRELHSTHFVIPNPWDAFMELELDVLEGRNEESFGGGSTRDLLYNARFGSFFEFSPRQNLNLGVSYLNGVHDVVADTRLRRSQER